MMRVDVRGVRVGMEGMGVVEEYDGIGRVSEDESGSGRAEWCKGLMGG